MAGSAEELPVCTAWCTATNDDEQAVPTVTLGPRRSKKCDGRAGSNDRTF